MRSRQASRTLGIVVAAMMVALEAVAPSAVAARASATRMGPMPAVRPVDAARMRTEPLRRGALAAPSRTQVPTRITLDGPAAVDTFVQTQELSTPNGLGDYFGSSVAIDGNTMVVVGSRDYLDPVDNCGYGVGYVYTRQPGSPFWDLTAHLRGSDHFGSDPPGDCYGYWEIPTSVAIHGDTIAIGANTINALPNYPGADAQGKVYIFRQHLGSWVDATEDTMLASTFHYAVVGEYRDTFGASVALEGENTLVVGAPYAFGGSGAAFVYEGDGLSTWTKVATLTPQDPEPLGAFGASVGISGRTIVVGNYPNQILFPPAGEIAVFDEPADGWADATPTVELPGFAGAVAYSVTIDGDTILAAGQSRVPYGEQFRALPNGVLVFERSGGAWDEVARLLPSDFDGLAGGQGDGFGQVVRLQGATAAVSAPADSNGAGAIYVFRKSGDSWGDPNSPPDIAESNKLIGENSRSGGYMDVAGEGLALDGTTIASGAFMRWQVVTSGCDACGPGPFIGRGGVFVFGQTTDTTPPTTTISRDPVAPNASGWDNTAPTISVSATDNPDGTGVFQVRCQVDGDEPTTFDQMAPACAYAPGKAFTTQSIHTLYAAAVDSAGNRSAVVRLQLKVDTVTPASTIDLSPANPDGADGSYTTPVTVTLNPHRDGIGSEIAEARCAVNPATPPARYEDLPICPTGFFYPGVEYQASGDYTVWVALLDDAGNKETPHSRTFSIHAAPTTTISVTPSTPTGSEGWYKAAVTVAVTATPVGTAHVVGYRCVLDPATPPTAYTDMPDACTFAAGGAKVTTDGRHVVYAASRDDHGNASPVVSRSINIDATPPTVTCDGSAPASFLLGDEDTEVTATVTDRTSGPASPTASTPVAGADLQTVGNRTKVVTGSDVAGNQASVSCAYVVGYDVNVVAPADGATFKAGTTVTVTFFLRNASGADISDADAATLLGGKKKPCLIAPLFDGVAQSGCPTYAAATDLFTLSVKTPKGRSVAGAHQVGVQIKAPNGTGIVNVVLIPILLN